MPASPSDPRRRPPARSRHPTRGARHVECAGAHRPPKRRARRTPRQRLVLPLRDAFAALFFFHFGLVIDPGEIGQIIGPAAAAVVMSLTLACVAAVGAARINALDRLAAANIAFSVVARQFALILATLATQAGLDERLTPFVAVYVLTLAIASPLLASRSRSLSRLFPTVAPGDGLTVHRRSLRATGGVDPRRPAATRAARCRRAASRWPGRRPSRARAPIGARTGRRSTSR